MKRRAFVKNSIPLLAVPGLIRGIPMGALAGAMPETTQRTGNKILVIIELTGGNDGLNTIIPLDQYKKLIEARGNILIPEKKIVRLADTDIVGLHPALKPLQELYNSKMMSVVQGVGYPNFSYSHFRAVDILSTASGADTVLPDGFLGRYIARHNPDYPIGYPSEKNPDPLAISVGKVRTSTVLQGRGISMGLSISTNVDFYNAAAGVNMAPPETNMGAELVFARQTSTLASQYGFAISRAAKKQKNLVKNYPKRNELADNLKIIAQLIGGGLQTPVYITAHYPFDHHSSQVDTSDPTKGKHAEMLHQFSEAMVAFMDDLHAMGVQDRVLCMVNSEFGRRIKSNASFGTDHGSAQPYMFFGPALKGGITGTNPVIPEKTLVTDNLEIYTAILSKWLNASDEDVEVSVPGKYRSMDLFK